MAKIVYKFYKKPRKKRPGIHSKNRSRTKGCSQYKKPYNRQGK